MVQLIVLYPQPTNVPQFETDYTAHVALLHEKTGIPTDQKPYAVTKFLAAPVTPHYYQMFSMPFINLKALQATMASTGMQEVAADANRISSGGPITILIGSDD